MNNIIFNYTEIMRRDKKTYEMFGATIPGASNKFIKILVISWAIMLTIFYGIRKIFGMNIIGFVAYSIGLGFLITVILWEVKIQQYRLYEYLRAYFKKRYTHTNQYNGKSMTTQRTLKNIKVDSVVVKIM